MGETNARGPKKAVYARRVQRECVYSRLEIHRYRYNNGTQKSTTSSLPISTYIFSPTRQGKKYIYIFCTTCFIARFFFYDLSHRARSSATTWQSQSTRLCWSGTKIATRTSTAPPGWWHTRTQEAKTKEKWCPTGGAGDEDRGSTRQLGANVRDTYSVNRINLS